MNTPDTDPGFPKSLMDAARFLPRSLEAPNAWCGHLPFAAWLIRELQPRIFVELGTHTGNSYFTFCQAVKESRLDTRCYAIDTWQGDEHAGSYSNEVFEKVNAHNQAYYAEFSRLLRMLFDDGLAYFSDGSVDLLHIDGLHTYEAVKHDFDTWLPKMAPGGVVLFHDSNVRENEFGVWQLWEELQQRYPNNFEFLHSHGLTVLQLDGGAPEKRLDFLSADAAYKHQFRDYFAALGARQLERFALKANEAHIAYLLEENRKQNGHLEYAHQIVELRDEQIASLQEKLTELERLNGQLQAFQDELLNSRSWRLTRPLRAAANLARRSLAGQKKRTFREFAPDSAAAVTPAAPVAVIVPVYRDIDMTVTCIETAMPAVLALPGAKLLAINDCSPDEGMQEALQTLQQRWPDTLHLLANESNLGFVATVNRGMKHFADHDVVLLNSDVVLPEGWLSRLQADAYLRPQVATATPLSNNTTICTFPDFLQDNPLPYGLDTQQVDKAFVAPRLPCAEAPTGIGFCMYIRRDALEKVGYFNEARFPRGYGEENDFCQRAIKAGLVNLISPNLFVYHQGGVSFADEKNALVENANKVLDELHPTYHTDVQRFIAEDPLRKSRILRMCQLISQLEIPKILHISHGMGGGVLQHIRELTEELGERAAAVWLHPDGDSGRVALRLGAGKHADTIEFQLPQDHDRLIEILRKLNISMVHYHHTMYLDRSLLTLGEVLGVPHLLTIHDYYLLNANPTLTDESGLFSGEYDDGLTNILYPRPQGMTSQQWRDMHRPMVEGAEAVIFPSQAAREVFGDHYKLKRSVVVPHPERGRPLNVPLKPWQAKKRRVVGVVGAISKEKGALLLAGMAALAREQGKPLDFVLIGYAHAPLAHVKVTGPYDADTLPELIEEHQVDILFFPARWAETYNYVLSYALGTGLPIVAPRVGAFPERLAGREATALFNHRAQPATAIAELEQLIAQMDAGTPPRCDGQAYDGYETSFYAADYLSTADTSQATQYGPEAFQFEVGERLQPVLSLREQALARIWRVYSHPSMAWVDRVVPYRLRRAVKRLFTRKPLHEVV